MATESKGTIWSDKNIPPMKYMTLKRASSILSCEEEDFWHWYETGAINLATRSEGGKFGAWARPKRHDEKEELADEIWINENSEFNDLCRELGIHIDVSVADSQKRRWAIMIDGSYTGGIWLFSSDEKGAVFRDGNSAEVALYAEVSGRKADYAIYREGKKSIDLTGTSVFVMKRDIERLYNSIKTGETLTKESVLWSGPVSPLEEDEKPGIRTGRMGEFIEALFYLAPDIGGDVLNMPANRRYSIIEAAFSKAREKIDGFNYQPPSQTVITKYLKV